MVGSTFGINSDEMQSAISGMSEIQVAMQDISERMTKTVRESLRGCGIEGEAADALVKQYEDKVLNASRSVDNRLEEQIAANRMALRNADDMEAETMKIAQG